MDISKIKELINLLDVYNSNITLKDFIESSIDFEVFEFDLDEKKCVAIKKTISRILFKYLREIQESGGISFSSKSNLNLRTEIPATIQRELEKKFEFEEELNLKSLGWAGYPRFEFNYGYLTIKALNIKSNKNLRTLYLSSRGIKVEKSGFHLAIIISYELENYDDSIVIYPIDFKIIDLSNIKLSIKVEFSATANQLFESEI